MFLSYFTEQPMGAYPEDEGLRAGYTSVLFSNKFFDPVEGSPPVPRAVRRSTGSPRRWASTGSW